jgi:integrase
MEVNDQGKRGSGRKPTGKHPHVRLNTAFVRSAPPGRHEDGQGLFLLVEPNGARRWGQRLTVRGKRRELGLGGFPVVSLAEAREAALENRRIARAGGDPLAERKRPSQIVTFVGAVDRYLAHKLKEFSNPKHQAQWRSTLEQYAVPVLGALPVDQIKTQDVLRVLEPIWLEKTETATRVRGRIEAVLSWATVAGHRSGDNPARWAGNLKELLPAPAKVAKAENQPALSLSDLPRWWQELGRREGMAARALAFLTLTAGRSGEVRGMTWDEVDLDAGMWTVPAARMKMKREHRVPLPVEAVKLLSALPRTSSPYVFFAPMGGMLSDMSISAVMRRMHEADIKVGGPGYLDRRSGRPAVPHGLRSTFRDWVAEMTHFPGEMAEVALAHRITNAVEAAYRRGDQIEKRRQMMDAWAGLINGGQEASILPFAPRLSH